jgi:hypothetical protein
MAKLKNEERFRIKVGKADSDPVGRIYQQIGGNRTAISELPVVLLIFQTLASRHLERWLHKRLERAAESGGSEWFYTSPGELVELFHEYVRLASFKPDSDEMRFQPATTEKQTTSTGWTSFARMGPAKNEDDVIVFLRRHPARKSTNELKSEKMRQGHQIQEVMEQLQHASIRELSQKTGFTVNRILDHVNWAIKRGYASLESKPERGSDGGSVGSIAPRYAGSLRGVRDAEGRTDKDRFFELWLEAAKQGKHLDVNIVVDLFPKRSPNTLRSWRYKFNDCGRGTTNRDYPRIAHGRAEEITEALTNLFGADRLSQDDIEQIQSATTPLP